MIRKNTTLELDCDLCGTKMEIYINEENFYNLVFGVLDDTEICVDDVYLIDSDAGEVVTVCKECYKNDYGE